METIVDILKEALLCEMANFRPKSTGLKVNIFISSGYVEGKKLQHGPRIKVSKTYSDTMNPFDTFVIKILSPMDVIGEHSIKTSDIEKIKEFIIINRELLLEFWEMEIDTSELVRNLKRVI